MMMWFLIVTIIVDETLGKRHCDGVKNINEQSIGRLIMILRWLHDHSSLKEKSFLLASVGDFAGGYELFLGSE
jgi:hypothetical protein